MARVERPLKPDFFPVFPMHLLMDEDYEHLDRAAWGSVFLLMQHQWMKGGTLPADRAKLAVMARCTPAELDALLEAWPKLRTVDGQEDRVAIPWLLQEYRRAIAAWVEFQQVQQERGRRSAEARKEKYGTAQPSNPNHGSNTGSNQARTTARTMARTAPEPPSHPIPSHPINTEEAIASSVSPAPDQPDAVPASPAVASFPCNGKPDLYQVTQAQVDEWAGLYPKLDIMQELRKAYAWLKADPARKKTARGMPRFLVGWLNRSNDSARSGPAPAPQTRSPAHRARVDADYIETLKTKTPPPQEESHESVSERAARVRELLR